MKYIALLRGINVSGQRRITMDALTKMFVELNLNNVQTYLQSGNVVFQANETDSKKLEHRISFSIKENFGIDVPVLVLSADTLKSILENCPFEKSKEAMLYITFLYDTPNSIDKQSIECRKSANEEIVFFEKAIYLYCPNGYGRTKLNNNFLENFLKVKATTRNWKTVNELLRIAS
ncbi:MAG: DUF1697 domain-containing protein [Parabacteroides sp.]